MTTVKPRRRQLDKADARSTETRILHAARAVFSSKGFFPTSVEEIAEGAQVSRATVYLYYRSKEEILFGLLREDLEHQLDRYRKLAGMQRPTLTAVKTWLREFRAAMDERRTSLNLFWVGASIDPHWAEPVRDHRDSIIAILGARFPGFSLEGLPGSTRETKQTRCYLMILLIESTVCFAEPMNPAKLPAGIDVLGRGLLNFFETGEISIA